METLGSVPVKIEPILSMVFPFWESKVVSEQMYYEGYFIRKKGTPSITSRREREDDSVKNQYMCVC